MVPNALVASILPTLLGYGASVEKIQPLLQRMSRYVLFLAVPLAAGAFVLADPLIPAIFGEAFRASVPVLRVISIVIVLRFHTVVMTNVFVAHHRELLRTQLQAVAVVIVVTANLVLVPRFGFMGTAFASLATEMFLWASYVVALRRIGHHSLGTWIWRPIVAAVGMAGLCWISRETLPILAVIAIGVVVYAVAMVALGAIEREDREAFRRLTQRPR
jgi:O-antigen/teichoic acid export membrane protein